QGIKPSTKYSLILINSSFLPLSHGTQQGCPLSPLLFDIAIEPLAIMIRNSANLTGVQRGGHVNKLSFYSDDLLFLSKPSTTIPIALNLIEKFGKNSFDYLGVCVTFDYNCLFNKNFTKALNKAKLDMEKWSELPLSLVGRINSVKMTIMHRFLYLFQTIPVFIPKKFFKELNIYLILCNHIASSLQMILRSELSKLMGLRFSHLFGGLPGFGSRIIRA
uniref:Reverse transcriptase domain-containing protein n=1 Tax=Poecilia reticulata TaxID=8081 RepID=A0A3P9PAD4_POERE